jgi:prepilin-type N-terminal cleavage/methylation domain-containing protein
MSRMSCLKRSGFSLVEVLISIVVLALGLLGLAAVFPAVINQQRLATDAVQGKSLGRSAIQYIENSALLNERSISVDLPAQRRGWDVLLAQRPGGATQGGWSIKGEWSLPSTGFALDQLPDGVGIGLDPVTGNMSLGLGTGYTLYIPLSERLIPGPYSSEGDPRYVWDMAVRRIEGGVRGRSNGPVAEWADDSVQICVFVRRVDSGIRLAPGVRSLSEAFTNPNLAPGARRVPVAVDRNGRPTFDGYGDSLPNYSAILDFTYSFPDETEMDPSEPRTVIIPDRGSSFDFLRPYVAQVGQKFVDQFGVVHEVTAVRMVDGTEPAAQRLRLVITPPLDPRTSIESQLPDQRRRMLFTPQIPVSVEVRTLTR